MMKFSNKFVISALAKTEQAFMGLPMSNV